MSKIDGSAPAFPIQGIYGSGLTMRAFLAAHAPDEPQPWFEPDMPPKPEMPRHPATPNDPLSQRVPAEAMDRYRNDHAEARRAIAVWQEEYKRQRYLQWPLAWADAMIEQMNKSCPT